MSLANKGSKYNLDFLRISECISQVIGEVLTF